jgi:hypothetical protein
MFRATRRRQRQDRDSCLAPLSYYRQIDPSTKDFFLGLDKFNIKELKVYVSSLDLNDLSPLDHLTQIEYLSIMHCTCFKLHPHTFTKFKRLRNLDLQRQLKTPADFDDSIRTLDRPELTMSHEQRAADIEQRVAGHVQKLSLNTLILSSNSIDKIDSHSALLA